MTRRLRQAALAVALLLAPAACAPAPHVGGSSANGAVGLTRDDALLYVADGDLDTVFVVDTAQNAVVAAVRVGRQPEKVLVAEDGTAFVTNRGDRSVSVLRPGDTTESARLEVGVEPVGLATSADGKTLYVVNATSRARADVGTLMAFDTSTLALRWEVEVGPEPRGVALLANGRAAVSLFHAGDVVYVDLAQGRVVQSGTDVFQRLNATALGLTTVTGVSPEPRAPSPFPSDVGTSHPRGLGTLISAADGTQVFGSALISSDAVLRIAAQGPEGTEKDPGVLGAPAGGGYGGGACGSTAVAAPALLTFDAEGQAQVDDLLRCFAEDATGRPATVLQSFDVGRPLQGPQALALDPAGRFLFVANHESNNVGVVRLIRDASGGSVFGGGTVDVSRPRGMPEQLVPVGAGPTGVAVASDGLRAWVYSSFDHTLSRLQAGTAGIAVVRSADLVLGDDVLSPDAAAGRRLFFSATDARMNSLTTGISCGTCHLEGRQDGHVWNFADGPRQTPSLAGRQLLQTAPFHWNGEFASLTAFMAHTVQQRMGGNGVSADMERQLAAFLEALPAADNPHRDTPGDVLARGKAAFDKARCGTCHGGAAFTDNGFADVGTFVTQGPVVDRPELLPHGALNTPSLLGLARTAPYLHDGSAATLEARLRQGQAENRHGATSLLSDAELADLVAYLLAL